MKDDMRIELDAGAVFDVVKKPIVALYFLLGVNLAATVVLLAKVF